MNTGVVVRVQLSTSRVTVFLGMTWRAWYKLWWGCKMIFFLLLSGSCLFVPSVVPSDWDSSSVVGDGIGAKLVKGENKVCYSMCYRVRTLEDKETCSPFQYRRYIRAIKFHQYYILTQRGFTIMGYRSSTVRAVVAGAIARKSHFYGFDISRVCTLFVIVVRQYDQRNKREVTVVFRYHWYWERSLFKVTKKSCCVIV